MWKLVTGKGGAELSLDLPLDSIMASFSGVSGDIWE